MRRQTRHPSLIFLALLASLLISSGAAANNLDEDSTDYSQQARVARISLLSGDVQLKRAGNREWESADLNLPLVEGDQLSTGKDSRLEVQIDAYNFVRVEENSILTVVTLRDEGIAFSLAEGTATLRLSRFDGGREYFEVDAPKTTMAAEKRGLYRLDASRNSSGASDVRITVRDGGRARIYSETSGFTLKDGRTARLFFDGTEEAGDWDLASAPALDGWDEWVEQREYALAQKLRYERRDTYYNSSLWGAEELDAYGDWSYAGSHGWVWRPHVTVINNYYNWTPYRYGHWRWVPPYGWTWIASEPWGWAPYHYGRWVYYNNSWCWAPHGHHGFSRRQWWSPALVVFVTINNNNYGNQVCWYPLPPRHPNPPVYAGNNNNGNVNGVLLGGQVPVKGGQVLANPKGGVKPLLADTAYLNAVTSVPTKDFGNVKGSGTRASLALAQVTIQSDPVPVTNLPVKSPKSQMGALTAGNNNEALPVRPRGRGDLSAPLAVPQTGAAVRKPGVALDEELRRTRLQNGREPVTKPGAASAGSETKDTGAVTRPVRPFGKPVTEPPTEKSDNDNAAPVRPRRPDANIKQNDGSSSTGTENQPVRPVRRPPEKQPDVPPPSQTLEPPRRQRPPERKPEVSEPVRPDLPVRQTPPPAPPPQKSEPPPRRQESEPTRRQESKPPPPPPAKSAEPPPGRSKGGIG